MSVKADTEAMDELRAIFQKAQGDLPRATKQFSYFALFFANRSVCMALFDRKDPALVSFLDSIIGSEVLEVRELTLRTLQQFAQDFCFQEFLARLSACQFAITSLTLSGPSSETDALNAVKCEAAALIYWLSQNPTFKSELNALDAGGRIREIIQCTAPAPSQTLAKFLACAQNTLFSRRPSLAELRTMIQSTTLVGTADLAALARPETPPRVPSTVSTPSRGIPAGSPSARSMVGPPGSLLSRVGGLLPSSPLLVTGGGKRASPLRMRPSAPQSFLTGIAASSATSPTSAMPAAAPSPSLSASPCPLLVPFDMATPITASPPPSGPVSPLTTAPLAPPMVLGAGARVVIPPLSLVANVAVTPAAPHPDVALVPSGNVDITPPSTAACIIAPPSAEAAAPAAAPALPATAATVSEPVVPASVDVAAVAIPAPAVLGEIPEVPATTSTSITAPAPEVPSTTATSAEVPATIPPPLTIPEVPSTPTPATPSTEPPAAATIPEVPATILPDSPPCEASAAPTTTISSPPTGSGFRPSIPMLNLASLRAAQPQPALLSPTEATSLNSASSREPPSPTPSPRSPHQQQQQQQLASPRTNSSTTTATIPEILAEGREYSPRKLILMGAPSPRTPRTPLASSPRTPRVLGQVPVSPRQAACLPPVDPPATLRTPRAALTPAEEAESEADAALVGLSAGEQAASAEFEGAVEGQGGMQIAAPPQANLGDVGSFRSLAPLVKGTHTRLTGRSQNDAGCSLHTFWVKHTISRGGCAFAMSLQPQLLESQEYKQVGSNENFMVQPPVLHFGGFRIGQAHRMKFSVVNKSLTAKRLDVLPPTTPFFRIFFSKTGRIAPGMSEDITVEFIPDQWRYYHDTIRVHCEGGTNLEVPVHGYPVMNSEAVFPKAIDFGMCPIGQRKSKYVTMECKIPVSFEYRLTWIEPHGDIVVEPMEGLVPAEGRSVVRVDFTPTRFATATARLKVELSQFGFVPVVCTITGSAMPGAIRDALLSEGEQLLSGLMLDGGIRPDRSPTPPGATRTLGASLRPSSAPPTEEALARALAHDEALKAMRQHPPSLIAAHPLPSLASKDPFSAAQALERSLALHNPALAASGTLTTSMSRTATALRRSVSATRRGGGSAAGGGDGEGMVVRDGVMLPPALDTVHAVNSVLLQQPGKLSFGALRRSMEGPMAGTGQESAEASSPASGAGESLGPEQLLMEAMPVATPLLEGTGGATGGSSAARQLKEAAFERLVKADTDRQKQIELSFSSDPDLGADLLTADHIKAVLLARTETSRREGQRTRNRERQTRFQAAAPSAIARPLILLPGPEEATEAWVQLDGGMPPPAPAPESLHFDHHQSDGWVLRKKVLQGFQRAAHTVILRARVAKRLRAIGAKLNQAGPDTHRLGRPFLFGHIGPPALIPDVNALPPLAWPSRACLGFSFGVFVLRVIIDPRFLVNRTGPSSRAPSPAHNPLILRRPGRDKDRLAQLVQEEARASQDNPRAPTPAAGTKPRSLRSAGRPAADTGAPAVCSVEVTPPEPAASQWDRLEQILGDVWTLKTSNLEEFGFPLYSEENFRSTAQIECPLIPTERMDWPLLPLEAPLYYRTQSYAPLPVAALPDTPITVPPELPMAKGAPEDAITMVPLPLDGLLPPTLGLDALLGLAHGPLGGAPGLLSNDLSAVLRSDGPADRHLPGSFRYPALRPDPARMPPGGFAPEGPLMAHAQSCLVRAEFGEHARRNADGWIHAPRASHTLGPAWVDTLDASQQVERAMVGALGSGCGGAESGPTSDEVQRRILAASQFYQAAPESSGSRAAIPASVRSSSPVKAPGAATMSRTTAAASATTRQKTPGGLTVAAAAAVQDDEEAALLVTLATAGATSRASSETLANIDVTPPAASLDDLKAQWTPDGTPALAPAGQVVNREAGPGESEAVPKWAVWGQGARALRSQREEIFARAFQQPLEKLGI
ncbi:putative Primary ciliary dyskinesia protein 1 [Paratrimastix pyriformis]|uniref:Primary ciliary dyskinesia protein 1 n=1 Tax=Paratrimastix pyriformis TaxID=342808 RepID=A0ABQ8UKS9_9EUKA|nr:putative Primary ciliary dyskinesia protein 1 [Paratrimastix pyriformis]